MESSTSSASPEAGTPGCHCGKNLAPACKTVGSKGGARGKWAVWGPMQTPELGRSRGTRNV
eukprot:2178690-Rhodomonas_salina.2